MRPFTTGFSNPPSGRRLSAAKAENPKQRRMERRNLMSWKYCGNSKSEIRKYKGREGVDEQGVCD
jgi:hypothetical protein